jgi:mono/diheme cytochrome c family protein
MAGKASFMETKLAYRPLPLIAATLLATAAYSFGSAFAQSDTQFIVRGEYLVETVGACGNCHTLPGPNGPMMDMHLGGGMPFEEEGFTAYAPNITPHEETGIGTWSDEEIITAIREGVRPDGSIIGPPMPIAEYRHLSDADAQAIVAYLRTVEPVENAVPASDYQIPLPPSYGPPVEGVVAPSPDDVEAYGEYLVRFGHCMECHTPRVRGQLDHDRMGEGGTPFHGPWGVSVSRNITPHAEDGIGAWSEADIIAAITQGVRPTGDGLFPPMAYAYYDRMTQDDLQAMVRYLRTIEPLPTTWQ